jgi:hypothetical protein
MSSILLISDEELVVESLQDDLNKLGYKVRLKKCGIGRPMKKRMKTIKILKNQYPQRKNPAILKSLLNNEI